MSTKSQKLTGSYCKELNYRSTELTQYFSLFNYPYYNFDKKYNSPLIKHLNYLSFLIILLTS